MAPKRQPKLASISKNLLSEFEEVEPNLLPTRLHVYLRIKPCELDSNQKLFITKNECSVTTRPPKSSASHKAVLSGISSSEETFEFSRVFEQHTDQRTIFRDVVLPKVANFLSGMNEMVFSYGTTSSGKTYTLQGDRENPGLIPHAFSAIFNSAQVADRVQFMPKFGSDLYKITQEELEAVEAARAALFRQARKLDVLDHCNCDTEARVPSPEPRHLELWVSFAEVYNEAVYDLLDPAPATKSRAKAREPLDLRLDRNACVYVKDLRWLPVFSVREMLSLLAVGRQSQQVAATALNLNSSRSHALFTLKAVHAGQSDSPMFANVSTLSFCDLAGSERSEKAATGGGTRAQRLREAANINNSLITFGRCIETMRHNQRNPDRPQWVPYRESKLTRLFQAFFTGRGRACMIVNASQNAAIFDETLHTLRFSALARDVTITVNRPQKTAVVRPPLADRQNLPPPDKQPPLQEDEEEEEEEEEDDDDAETTPQRKARASMEAHLVQLSRRDLHRLIAQVAEQLHEAKAQVVQTELQLRRQFATEIDEEVRRLESKYLEYRREAEASLNREIRKRIQAEVQLEGLRMGEAGQQEVGGKRAHLEPETSLVDSFDEAEELEEALQERIRALEDELGERNELVEKLAFEVDELRLQCTAQSFAMAKTDALPADFSRVSLSGEDTRFSKLLPNLSAMNLASPPAAEAAKKGAYFAPLRSPEELPKGASTPQTVVRQPDADRKLGGLLAQVAALTERLAAADLANDQLKQRLLDQASLLRPKRDSRSLAVQTERPEEEPAVTVTTRPGRIMLRPRRRQPPVQEVSL